jgi:hypothetical protein
MWIAGGTGATAGRRDNYVFQDGLDYHFMMSALPSGDWVDITITVAADPGAPGMPTNVTATPIATLLRANITWTNPTLTYGGDPLTNITKVVIERDGTPVHQITSGVNPGANMSWTDNNVPNSGDHCYSVLAVNAIGEGPRGTDCGTFGDMCNLRFVMSDDFGDGWGTDGGITVKVDGVTYGFVACPNGVSWPQTITAYVLVPSGELTLTWSPGSWDMESYVEIYDPADNLLFISGPPGYWLDGCEPGIGMCNMAGVIHNSDFSCGAGAKTFNIYRDGVLIEEFWPMTMYQDLTMNPFYAHCWEVRAVCTGDGRPESDPIEICLPICKDVTEYLVFGKVEAADGNAIVGAAILLKNNNPNAPMEYPTTTVADGRFELDNIFIASYTLTVTKTGYKPHTQIVEVSGHTNLGTIILYDVPYPPTGVTAQEVDVSSALVKWNVPATPPVSVAGIVGYRVWRLLVADQNDESKWTILNNTPLNALQYNDFGWGSLASGDYMYAVRTCYTGIESAPAFSNMVPKRINVVYTIHITTDNGASPAGAVVTLTHVPVNAQFDLTGTSGNTGVSFPAVRQGDYTLKITLAGYTDYTESLSIMENGSHSVELISVKYLVTFNVTDCKTGDAIEGATIVVDGATITGYTVNKPAGTYPYTVAKDEYGIKYGNITVVNQPLTVDVCLNTTGIEELPEGDFILYPNPATSTITVERATATPATIEVYNAMGMHIGQYETLEAKFEINIYQLAAGTYFVRVTEDTSTIVHSFVKK